jgi:copper oxidase (laccase) domain-containing protein
MKTETCEINQWQTLNNLNTLNSRLTYAFSSRYFGNMSFRYGDYEGVLNNRRRFTQALGINLEDIVAMNPVHKLNIGIVGTNDRGKGAFDLSSAVPSTDALITTIPGVALALNPADCAPIIITNNQTEFLALIHAGREGTNLGICQVVVSKLEKMGFDPRQFVVGIGPAIGCYAQDYIQTHNPDVWLPHLFIPQDCGADIVTERINHLEPPVYQIRANKPGIKIEMDMIEANIAQLQSVGILRDNIGASYLCTACNAKEQRTFSHRISSEYAGTFKAATYPEGRFMAVVQLNS